MQLISGTMEYIAFDADEVRKNWRRLKTAIRKNFGFDDELLEMLRERVKRIDADSTRSKEFFIRGFASKSSVAEVGKNYLRGLKEDMQYTTDKCSSIIVGLPHGQVELGNLNIIHYGRVSKSA